eukprot:CAMPEP_0172188494 /NCGR_PEP_ID=MMETSP1050-20130122/21961_1 /TAXON_ID=233186 /ORGANISM="Cryptomonas curvata, Strain CCAP979/52" /LENGTH=108 /DNA_ID=CAMNT_0012863007 /DNA_START=411 /DNA_END=734 /DNA_ORIENTATION=+
MHPLEVVSVGVADSNRFQKKASSTELVSLQTATAGDQTTTLNVTIVLTAIRANNEIAQITGPSKLEPIPGNAKAVVVLKDWLPGLVNRSTQSIQRPRSFCEMSVSTDL